MQVLKFTFSLLCLLILQKVHAQQAAALDSMKFGLKAARTVEEKAYWLDNISRTLMNVNPVSADSVGLELIKLAEESRDRKLMIKAYQSNGIRNGFFKGQKIYANKAIGYIEKALAVATENRMKDETAACQFLLADVYLNVPEYEKAMNYVAEGISQLRGSKNDSLKIESHLIQGKVFEATNAKIAGLKNYLDALLLAEEIEDNEGNRKRKAELKRSCYLRISNFYGRIEDYPKAIDYYTYAYKELDNIRDKRVPYQRCIDINSLGNLFAAQKNHDIAISYYERSIAMADSLNFSNLKVPGYISLLNQYLRMEQPEKAMAYMKSQRGQELMRFLNQFRMLSSIYQAWAYIYTGLNRFDSAKFYLDKAIPLFEQTMNETITIAIYHQAADFYKKTNNYDKALEYYEKCKNIALRNGMLEMMQMAAAQMDSIYQKKGDFQTARTYYALYQTYRDSSKKLTEENKVTKEMVAYETDRENARKAAEAERKKRKNNIQYMIITMGIVVLFVVLVLLGMFKVSAGFIKAIGFFVFLMLFEFIFLVFKKNIYSITNGEPLKDLMFMIGLAALLVPLHHWLEHNVLHFLTSHNRLTAAGHHIRKKLFRRAGTEGE